MEDLELIEQYDQVKRCEYKGRTYLVRDNGAVFRLPNENGRISKWDCCWTFGKPNYNKGYMEIAGQVVHRIVAYAFLGNPPTDQHVVDHIDTNRRNNRPENLRWVTKLENVLNNPITIARIENVCGSVEAFLADPSILRGHEKNDPNFSWMRAVSPEEARVSWENLMSWAIKHPKTKGGNLGEWVFHELNSNAMSSYQNEESIETVCEIQSNTPNAKQINWQIISEFPCCPKEPEGNPLEYYQSNLKPNNVFCINDLYCSLVLDSAIADNGKSLWVMTQRREEDAVKPWALSRVTYRDGFFIHESRGSFSEEKGALKYFTLAQGKEWTGGEVFDDYC